MQIIRYRGTPEQVMHSYPISEASDNCIEILFDCSRIALPFPIRGLAATGAAIGCEVSLALEQVRHNLLYPDLIDNSLKGPVKTEVHHQWRFSDAINAVI